MYNNMGVIATLEVIEVSGLTASKLALRSTNDC